LGVPLRVALYASSPRFAAGFTLQSLTQNYVSKSEALAQPTANAQWVFERAYALEPARAPKKENSKFTNDYICVTKNTFVNFFTAKKITSLQ
jgi:hypothetical protein